MVSAKSVQEQCHRKTAGWIPGNLCGKPMYCYGVAVSLRSPIISFIIGLDLSLWEGRRNLVNAKMMPTVTATNAIMARIIFKSGLRIGISKINKKPTKSSRICNRDKNTRSGRINCNQNAIGRIKEIEVTGSPRYVLLQPPSVF